MKKKIKCSSERAKLQRVKSLLSTIYDAMEDLYRVDSETYYYANLGAIEDDVETALREVAFDIERI